MSEIACRRRAVTSSTRARPDSLALMSTSRLLSGLGRRSTHPPATIRSIDRLNVDEFAPIRSARLPIRSGPALVNTTSTRNCGSVTNSSAGETDRATTPKSARDTVRIASVVWAWSRGEWRTTPLSSASLICACKQLLQGYPVKAPRVWNRLGRRSALTAGRGPVLGHEAAGG